MQKTLMLLLGACLGLSVFAQGSGESVAPLDRSADNLECSRVRFAKAMARLQIGADEATVTLGIGKPDEVRNPEESCPLSSKNLWCYGVKTRGGFPTLGQILFGRDGKVKRIYGNRAVPFSPGLIDEEEMRHLLEVLSEGPNLKVWSYDPKSLIRVVNALQPAGRVRTIAAMKEFLRVAPDWHPAREGLLLVLRALFDPPEETGYFQPVDTGVALHVVPTDFSQCPRFPLVLVEDVPVMLPYNPIRAGEGPDINKAVDYFSEHAVFRGTKIVPPNNPLVILRKLKESKQWIYHTESDATDAAAAVCCELLRLIDTAYCSDRDFEDFRNTNQMRSLDKEWAENIDAFQRVHAQWNPRKQSYEK